MDKKTVLIVLLSLIVLSSFAYADTDIASLRAQYEAQKIKSERAHQIWLDCLDCYVAGRDDCPLCVPLEEADNAEAMKLNAIDDELREAKDAEDKSNSAGSGIMQADNSDFSGKSVQELSEIRIQLSNALSEMMIEYDDSLFESAMKQVFDGRIKDLEDSLKRVNACYDACSGEKFQAGGNGQACVQPCLDRADAESKRIMQEFDRIENAAYIDDINRMRDALDGAAPEVKETLPEGPKININDNRGRTPSGSIAPSFGGYLGDVYVTRSDGTKVIPGKELYLKVDDKVITGKDSKVNIIFGNAGNMYLGPNTELRVGSALLDQYYLAKGSLKSTVGMNAGVKLEFRTPTASVSVKGTEFVIEHDEITNATDVFLNEGSLEIYSRMYSLNLTRGNHCVIGPDGAIMTDGFTNDDWKTLGERFYDPAVAIMKVYAWMTFAVLIISSIISLILLHVAKTKHKKADDEKNLGVRSVMCGVFGTFLFLVPIIGFPLSVASATLARIQKLRLPTTSAKIGFIMGSIGVILNGFMVLMFCLNTIF